jgi:hypothetical protein
MLQVMAPGFTRSSATYLEVWIYYPRSDGASLPAAGDLHQLKNKEVFEEAVKYFERCGHVFVGLGSLGASQMTEVASAAARKQESEPQNRHAKTSEFHT